MKNLRYVTILKHTYNKNNTIDVNGDECTKPEGSYGGNCPDCVNGAFDTDYGTSADINKSRESDRCRRCQ